MTGEAHLRPGGTAARGHCGCRGAQQPASAEGRCSWQRVPGGTAAIFLLSPAVAPLPPLQHRRETASSDDTLRWSSFADSTRCGVSLCAEKRNIPSPSPPGWRALCLFFHGLVKHSKRHIVLGDLAMPWGPSLQCLSMATPWPLPAHLIAILKPCSSQCHLKIIPQPSPGHPLAMSLQNPARDDWLGPPDRDGCLGRPA